MTRTVGNQFEFNLIELLPLAPTYQRSQELLTAYNPKTREYTVAVQNYPGVGIDTYFVVSISNDVTSATSIHSNIIIGHPDGQPGNVGTKTLTKILIDKDDRTVALFNDGSLHLIDIPGKAYTQVSNILTPAKDIVPATTQVTKAHLVVDTKLKSLIYDQLSNQAYIVVTDMSSSPYQVASPVAIQPYSKLNGAEAPIAAHQVTDPNTGISQFAVIFAGNFDRLMWVDETTGKQTDIIDDMYGDATGTGADLTCDEGTKDCDTEWSTSAYDPVSNIVYIQAHAVQDDDSSETMIYGVQFLANKVTKVYYPYLDPLVDMNFGYSGYQWVTFQ